MNYPHLTQDERYPIAILDKAGHDKSDIARGMNRDKSTIGRERARNRGKRGYRPKQAHEKGSRIAAETWAVVERKLAETGSPEQISGHLKANSQPTVSHEAIYPRIYADKSAGGTLHLALRCQKVRKKRCGGRDRRGIIPYQVSIDLRPVIVADRARFGDGEADLVIGAGQKQALVSLFADRSCAVQDGAGGLSSHNFLADAFCSLCSHDDDR